MSIKSIVVRDQERFQTTSNSSHRSFDEFYDDSYEDFDYPDDNYEEGSWYVRKVSAGSNLTCSSESVFSSDDEEETSGRPDFTRSLSAESDEIFQDTGYTLRLLSRRDSSDSGRGRGSWSSSPRSKSVPAGAGRDSSDEGPPKSEFQWKNQDSAPPSKTRITIKASRVQPTYRPRARTPSPRAFSRPSSRQSSHFESKPRHRDIELRDSPVTVPFEENQHITAHAHYSAVDDRSDASSIFSSKSGDTVVHKAEHRVPDRRKSSAYIALSKPPQSTPLLSPPGTPQPRKRVKTETVTKVTTYTTRASTEDLDNWITAGSSSPRLSATESPHDYPSGRSQQRKQGSGVRDQEGQRLRSVDPDLRSKGFDITWQEPGSYRNPRGQPYIVQEEKLNTLRVRSRSQSTGRRDKETRVQQSTHEALPKKRNQSHPVPRRTERPDFYHVDQGQHVGRHHVRSAYSPRDQGYSLSWIDRGQISDGYLSDCSSIRQSHSNAILGRSEITKATSSRQEFSSTGSLTRSQTLPRSYKGPVFKGATDHRKPVGDENNLNKANFKPIRNLPTVTKEPVRDQSTPVAKGSIPSSIDVPDGRSATVRNVSSSSLKVEKTVSKHRTLSEVKRFSRVSREDLAQQDSKHVTQTTEVEVDKKAVKQKKKKKEKKSKRKSKGSITEDSKEIITTVESEKKGKESERKKVEKEHLLNEFKRLAKLDSEAEEDFTLRKSYSLPYRKKKEETVKEVAVEKKEIQPSQESPPSTVPSIQELKKTNLSFDERIKEQRQILLQQISQKRGSVDDNSNDTSHSQDVSGASESEIPEGNFKRSNTLPIKQNPPTIHVTDVNNHHRKSEEFYRQQVVTKQQPEVYSQPPQGWEQFQAKTENRRNSSKKQNYPVKPIPVQPFVVGSQRHTTKTEESTKEKLQKHNQILQETVVCKQVSNEVSQPPQLQKEYIAPITQKKPSGNRVQFRAREGYHWQYPSENKYYHSENEQRNHSEEYQSNWQRVEESKTSQQSFEEAKRREYSSVANRRQAIDEVDNKEEEGEKKRGELVRVYARGSVIQLSLEHDDGEEFHRTHPPRNVTSQGENTAYKSTGDSPDAVYDPRSSLRVKKNSDPILTDQSEGSISKSGDSLNPLSFGAFQPYQTSTFQHPNGTVYTPKTIRQLAKYKQYDMVNQSEYNMVADTETHAQVTTVTKQQVYEPEIVHYAICTHYFQPELNDNIYNFHRRGKIVVPSGLEHIDTCIFYNHLYVLEEEEVYIEKIVERSDDVCKVQEEPVFENENTMYDTSSTPSESSYSSQRSSTLPKKHRNPFTSLKGEKLYNTLGDLSDQNNNNDFFNNLDKSFGTSYETLRHKKRSIHDELISNVRSYTPTSPGGSDKTSDHHFSLSKPRLLRKSPVFPGVSHEVEDDYPKLRPKTPEAPDRHYGISLGLAQ